METMIIFEAEEGKRAYPIQHIVIIKQNGKVVSLILAAPFNAEMPEIICTTEEEAINLYEECLDKIEKYYQTMLSKAY